MAYNGPSDNSGNYGTGMGATTASNHVNTANAATFIPEIWSDEIIASYEKSLKLSPLCKKMSMKGKKGDTIRLPVPGRGAVSSHTQGSLVTIQSNVEDDFVVVVDRHHEYSRLVDDIVEVQAFSSLRSHYTQDAGYQHAKKVDTDIGNMFVNVNATGAHTAPGSLIAGTPTDAQWAACTGAFTTAASTGALVDYTAALAPNTFTDQTFRELIVKLDDRDVPMDGRVFVVPPALRSTMMGIDRFVSSDFSDQQAVKSGRIGSLYGVDIYVTTNCPTTNSNKVALFFHKDCILHVEQMGVRTQTQYKQEYLSTLFTADALYGLQVYRPEAGLALVV